MRSFATALVLAPFLALPTALAADAPKDDASELSDYARTGQTKSCLRASDIDTTTVLNNHQVLLRTKFNEYYLGEMPSCPQLNRSLSLVYDATPNDLCTTTIVHLADFGTPAVQRGACAFASFEVLKKKPK